MGAEKMIHDILHTTRLMEWGVAERTLPGETESGDSHLVKALPDGILMAVVDGLGHGPEAAEAARAAVTTLEVHAHGRLVELLERCHQELRHTRGVVMSLAWLSRGQDSLTWLGVGDVEGRVMRATRANRNEALLLRGGVVGYEIPRLRSSQLTLEPGDLLILATDGIRAGFSDELDLHRPAQQLADEILAEHGRMNDDALVLVARYRGHEP
jgi:serine/threonine protein phosphatase PrpC